MFTNGHHHSSTHVALAIAQHTRKIKRGTKRTEKMEHISRRLQIYAEATDHVYPHRAFFVTVSSALRG